MIFTILLNLCKLYRADFNINFFLLSKSSRNEFAMVFFYGVVNFIESKSVFLLNNTFYKRKPISIQFQQKCYEFISVQFADKEKRRIQADQGR